MRKIKTAEDVARVERRNKLVGGIVVVVLLVVSSLGYSLMSGDGSGGNDVVEEMGLEFYEVGGYWATNIAGEVFYFSYLPSEVADVDVDLNLSLENYYQDILYFVNSNEGVNEVLNNLGRYVLRYQEACLKGVCEGDFPVKDCSSNLIIFEGEENRVYNNESCVYLSGDLKATDAFLYDVLDII